MTATRKGLARVGKKRVRATVAEISEWIGGETMTGGSVVLSMYALASATGLATQCLRRASGNVLYCPD